VTAGTGAGKTESFLLPILSDLFRASRKPAERGVRAIFLYPMNALVNDQVERLSSWLEASQGLGNVECKERLQYFHNPDSCGESCFPTVALHEKSARANIG
jgi:Lhr-like helicase